MLQIVESVDLYETDNTFSGFRQATTAFSAHCSVNITDVSSRTSICLRLT